MPGGGGRIDAANINQAVVMAPPRKKAAKKAAAEPTPADTAPVADKAG